MIAYAIDRLLYRLGRSKYAKEFFLKGGVLVANLMDAPHRFTRDIDLMRRRGPSIPSDLRQKFRQIVAVKVDDGVYFDPEGVRAELATRPLEGYEGIKVAIRARVGESDVDLRVDIGFGDAVVPPAIRTSLKPFLLSDPPPQVFAYRTESVLAEKIETILAKFPAIRHRLKDILDVAVLSATETLENVQMAASLRATLQRRKTVPDVQILDDMRAELRGKKWETDWATMRKEKAVAGDITLQAAVEQFERFVRPLLVDVQ
ncbi:nucleotidyl transferase AbiEii/AbiGii toxin family protein [Nannocystis punicea]|uniref:Nucleotidyl transferase AbiEii/AbiGii toxin family protein n=1 Tax=Nannocystis punicea TaxID=2995304 RepID=A0ABY7H2K9_9BACT|nr:nucleotidyl transferase AbiEii/AbiGii toxin family protein [Nannocystis poenicansa]WAS93377.1 nucleotidyl transferase AbiEii/AbiGii toxin family protein [Nannocystis poenicansa]